MQSSRNLLTLPPPPTEKQLDFFESQRGYPLHGRPFGIAFVWSNSYVEVTGSGDRMLLRQQVAPGWLSRSRALGIRVDAGNGPRAGVGSGNRRRRRRQCVRFARTDLPVLLADPPSESV